MRIKFGEWIERYAVPVPNGVPDVYEHHCYSDEMWPRGGFGHVTFFVESYDPVDSTRPRWRVEVETAADRLEWSHEPCRGARRAYLGTFPVPSLLWPCPHLMSALTVDISGTFAKIAAAPGLPQERRDELLRATPTTRVEAYNAVMSALNLYRNGFAWAVGISDRQWHADWNLAAIEDALDGREFARLL